MYSTHCSTAVPVLYSFRGPHLTWTWAGVPVCCGRLLTACHLRCFQGVYHLVGVASTMSCEFVGFSLIHNPLPVHMIICRDTSTLLHGLHIVYVHCVLHRSAGKLATQRCRLANLSPVLHASSGCTSFGGRVRQGSVTTTFVWHSSRHVIV